MSKIIPEIAVSSMEKSLAFYELLGFVKTADGVMDEQGSQWSGLALGDTSLWLTRQDIATGFRQDQARGNGININVTVDDVDFVREKVAGSAYKGSVVRDIETAYYGLRHFSIADPDGYILTLNMQVAQQDAAWSATT